MEDLLQFSGNEYREKTIQEKFERTDRGLKELDDLKSKKQMEEGESIMEWKAFKF